MDPEKIKAMKLIDIGDIVGFQGTIRRTPRGELSIKATDYKLLSKARASSGKISRSYRRRYKIQTALC